MYHKVSAIIVNVNGRTYVKITCMMSPINPLCRSGNSDVSQIALSRHSLPEYPELQQMEKSQRELIVRRGIRGTLWKNERSYGLVVAVNNCLLCALRFSKYRIEGSYAYVIHTYLCISESGNVTQFPGVPNARKMEPGVHSPRISPLISLLFATAARLGGTCPAINADSDVIIDGNNRVYRVVHANRVVYDILV